MCTVVGKLLDRRKVKEHYGIRVSYELLRIRTLHLELVYAIFMDFEKAYDSVWESSLEVLTQYGVHVRLFNVVKSLIEVTFFPSRSLPKNPVTVLFWTALSIISHSIVLCLHSTEPNAYIL